MKKIDFHIHTVPTTWDAGFSFDLDTLKRYVSEAGLHAIAITNHNVFDRTQFDTIQAALAIPVFPGVEVSLDCGHLLVIADQDKLDGFESQVQALCGHLVNINDRISLDTFLSLFDNLDDCLVIPHHGKSNAISIEALARLGHLAFCGEVTSPKKFMSAKKNGDALTPVIFSDCRISTALDPLPTRQTYVDCGEITLAAFKTSLRDRTKVDLSETHGLFQLLENGQMLSTGLNVVIGGRSSGKTHLLDQIDELHDDVKYIKQFSLVEQDETKSSREFDKALDRNESRVADEYLATFREVVDDVFDIDLTANLEEVEEYVDSLHETASELHRQDVFSKTALYSSSPFPTSDNSDLKDLIEAVQLLIKDTKYREMIDEHLDTASLKRLAVALILRYWTEEREREKRKFVNTLIRDIKQQLQTRTGAPTIEDIDLYGFLLDRVKVARFGGLVAQLQSPGAISEERILKFRKVAMKGPFKGVRDVKNRSGTTSSFRDAFAKYDDPYEYLRELKQIDVPKAGIYKLFVDVRYVILNQHDLPVSGGERSEFNLLEAISDAQKYDLLLIDEPESSFDNLFLRSDVNTIIKNIAKTMPVVVVTHNSTVGASIAPNYVVYTEKTVVGGEPVFKIYSGYPTDKALRTVENDPLEAWALTLDCLEGGAEAYNQRNLGYEALKG